MEKSRRRKVVAVALIGIAVASFAIANFASALTSKGARQSVVFAKVYGMGDWIKLDTTELQTLLSTTLPNIPVSAYYYVVCDGYAAIHDSALLGIAIGVDNATEDENTHRFFHDEGIATKYTGIHTECLFYLGPGSHTFYFLGRLYYEIGNAYIRYHTITVIVFTDGSLTELAATAEVGVAPD